MRTSTETLWALLVLATAAGCGKHSPDGAAAPGPSSGAASAAAAASAAPAPEVNPLAFLSGFEGQIDATMTEAKSKDGPQSLSLRIKNDKVRFDVPEKLTHENFGSFGKPNYVVFDANAKKLFVVSDPAKQVLTLDFGSADSPFKAMVDRAQAHRPGAPDTSKTPPKITKTGKTEKIAGYSCEDWDITSDHREGTACIAEQGASWFHFPAASLPGDKAWMSELLDGKHIPLRFVAYEQDGATQKMQVEVTKLDKYAQPAADFEYPPSYKVVDLAQMMQGFAAMASAQSMGAGQPPMFPQAGQMPMVAPGQMPKFPPPRPPASAGAGH